MKKIDEDNILIVVKLIALLSILVIIGFGLNDLLSKSENLEVSTVTLTSIDYSSTPSGSFILGCGKLNNSEYYVAYALQEDGGKKLVKYSTNDTIIYESLAVGEEAYAEITYDGFKTIKGVKLYLPENTIKQEYNLNLS